MGGEKNNLEFYIISRKLNLVSCNIATVYLYIVFEPETFINLAIHCEWNDWVLGDCSKECGTGTRINTRTKSVEEINGGTCTGQATEEEECLIVECPGS